MFRGCAGNYFPHDEKCEVQEQAVTIVEGKKSVDVGVTLCYCNKDLCNEELSGALTNSPAHSSRACTGQPINLRQYDITESQPWVNRFSTS